MNEEPSLYTLNVNFQRKQKPDGKETASVCMQREGSFRASPQTSLYLVCPGPWGSPSTEGPADPQRSQGCEKRVPAWQMMLGMSTKGSWVGQAEKGSSTVTWLSSRFAHVCPPCCQAEPTHQLRTAAKVCCRPAGRLHPVIPARSPTTGPWDRDTLAALDGPVRPALATASYPVLQQRRQRIILRV